MKNEKNMKFLLNNMANWWEIEKNAKLPLNIIESCCKGLKCAPQASNRPLRSQACPKTSNLIFRHKSSPRPQTPPQLPLRPAIFPLRTSGNSPLCPTGHRPFGAAALLSLHCFTGSPQAGHRVPLTMCDPWMTSCVCLTIEEGRVGVRNPHWGWGLDTPAHLFAILLWPLVTCPTLCKSEEKAWQSEIVLTPEKNDFYFN